MGSMVGTEANMANKPMHAVKQATTKQHMDDIMDIIWAANYSPYEPFAQLFFPVPGFRPSDREAAIAESKDRFWGNHLQQVNSSNWFLVEELETDKAVGCGQWEFYDYNPFPDGPPKLRAPWWPEGDHRNFCELILNQVYKPRASWMTRPHIALNWMAVHPLHRRRGVADILMRIGTSIADEHNVEAWMEASPMGRPVYEKHGFRSLFKIAFDTEKQGANGVWRKCEHEMTPEPVFAMWRPKGGAWTVDEVEVKMPWELGHVTGRKSNKGINGRVSPESNPAAGARPNSHGKV